MTTSKFESVTLQVDGDPMSEVFLVDGSMRRIASGIDSLTAEVPPGIYKIRSRKGGDQSDRLIEVGSQQAQQWERAPGIEGSSAAPIYGTKTSHEYQAEPAHRMSLRSGLECGRGSQLLVFIRDPDVGPDRLWALPAQSVSIVDLGGQWLFDLDLGESNAEAGYCGINVGIDPGTWRLRVETGPLGSFEIFVTTVRGWQTQVFLTLEDFPHKNEVIRRPSLKDALVMMAKVDRGFDPHGEDVRLVSLARTALAYNRPLMSDETMRYLVYGKFGDPLFGIYALSLLLLEKKQQVHDTSEIIRNLRRLLGPNHPDLLALRLAFNPNAKKIKGPLSRPPLLYQSWQQLVQVSRGNNQLIPGDSLLGHLAEDFVAMRPWLIRRVPNEEIRDQPRGTASLASAKRTLANLIQLSPELDLTVTAELSGLEAQIVRRLDDQMAMNKLLNEHETTPNEEIQANRIFSQVNAPGYSIANAVERLADRFNIPRS